MATVHNPSLPYTFESKGCQTGYVLQVEGNVPEEAQTFAINFKTADGDNAFHFNPRFGENTLVMNTFQGSWGCEERAPCASLSRGNSFKLTILVENDKYMVALNGAHQCHFGHRIAKELVKTIEVVGDVEITLINEATAFTSAGPIINPTVPFTAFIPGGFTSERILLVYGESTGDAFSINLQCGHEQFKNVGFHLNPRFHQNTCVLNDCKDGSWGPEQVSDLTIKPGQSFVVEIVCHSDTYHVRVNGAEFGHFEHRHIDERPLQCLDTLHITGDVKIHQLRL